jgi:hypothetical protein
MVRVVATGDLLLGLVQPPAVDGIDISLVVPPILPVAPLVVPKVVDPTTIEMALTHRSFGGTGTGCAKTSPTLRHNSTAETRRHAIGNFILSAPHAHARVTMRRVRSEMASVRDHHKQSLKMRWQACLSRATSQQHNPSKSIDEITDEKEASLYVPVSHYNTALLRNNERDDHPGLESLGFERFGTAKYSLCEKNPALHPDYSFPIFGTGTIDGYS